MALNGSEWLSGSIKYISAVCESVEQTKPSEARSMVSVSTS